MSTQNVPVLSPAVLGAALTLQPYSFAVADDEKHIIIRCAISPPRQSKPHVDPKTGETRGGVMQMTGGTNGWKDSGIEINGSTLRVMANVGFYPRQEGHPADVDVPQELEQYKTQPGFSVAVEDNELVLTLEVQGARQSKPRVDPKTGKTKGGAMFLVGGTGGWKMTGHFVSGQMLRVSAIIGYPVPKA